MGEDLVQRLKAAEQRVAETYAQRFREVGGIIGYTGNPSKLQFTNVLTGLVAGNYGVERLTEPEIPSGLVVARVYADGTMCIPGDFDSQDEPYSDLPAILQREGERHAYRVHWVTLENRKIAKSK